MSSTMPCFLKMPTFWPSSATKVSPTPRAPTAILRESSAWATAEPSNSATQPHATFAARTTLPPRHFVIGSDLPTSRLPAQARQSNRHGLLDLGQMPARAEHDAHGAYTA